MWPTVRCNRLKISLNYCDLSPTNMKINVACAKFSTPGCVKSINKSCLCSALQDPYTEAFPTPAKRKKLSSAIDETENKPSVEGVLDTRKVRSRASDHEVTVDRGQQYPTA